MPLVRWSEEEDSDLSQAVTAQVDSKQTLDWDKIASHLLTLGYVRSAAACKGHWNRTNRTVQRRVGRPWGEDESRRALDMIKTQLRREDENPANFLPWSKTYEKCSKELGHRGYYRTSEECETLWLLSVDSSDEEEPLSSDRSISISDSTPLAQSSQPSHSTNSNYSKSGSGQIAQDDQLMSGPNRSTNIRDSTSEIASTTEKRPYGYGNSDHYTYGGKQLQLPHESGGMPPTFKKPRLEHEGVSTKFSTSDSGTASSPPSASSERALVSSANNPTIYRSPINDPTLRSLVFQGINHSKEEMQSLKVNIDSRISKIRTLNKDLQAIEGLRGQMLENFDNELEKATQKIEEKRKRSMIEVDREFGRIQKALEEEKLELEKATAKMNVAMEDEGVFGGFSSHLQKRLAELD